VPDVLHTSVVEVVPVAGFLLAITVIAVRGHRADVRRGLSGGAALAANLVDNLPGVVVPAATLAIR
jgi:hypothetical protein